MTKPKPPTEAYVQAFADLAKHTAPKCGACRVAYICCSAEQCAATRDFALETFGETLVEGSGPLPFLGSEGCTVPPHLRPICSVHVCEQHLNDDAWSLKYESLRDAAGDLLQEAIEIASQT